MSFAIPLKHKALAAAALLIALGIAACSGTLRLIDSHTETTNDAYVAADFTLVAPRVAGPLVEVRVDDNQIVHAGQLLLRIDDRDFRAALMSAQADVEAARAAVAHDEAEIARQPALVEQARAALRADDAALQFAQANDARFRDLADNGAGTAQDQQRAASALAGALAKRAGDAAALASISQNLAVLGAQRDKANGALARAEAAFEQAKLNLSYTEVRAPVDGKVGRRTARVGAFVTPGAPLLAIVPLANAYVVANFQENQIGAMRPGDRVRIRIDSQPNVDISGHVDSLAPATGVSFAPIAPDNATGNFTKVVQRVPVKIAIDGPREQAAALSVGLSVEASVDTGAHRDGANAAEAQR
ncbi:HlyD family secretion protein [Burkholderia metallica]|uniref:HlyD family secretion protein n=1 Tax=Burkholderia metallica TaxID=488729 RepID=UPI001575A9D1|nr:HlyD family secretion protein [Burkholderia metallica]NTZ09044.1 HlyD family secretion protein [Burkholderia metallica]